MLINLSNHPSLNWGQEQLQAAKEQYGQVEDLAFPQIQPEATTDEIHKLAEEYLIKCTEMFKMDNYKIKHQAKIDAVHIMGEMTFTYQVVKKLSQAGICCLASTTKRQSVENPDGTKISVFQFVRFRNYA